ncbi:MAG: Integral rane protein TerC [Gemmatimonadetes bacterium]|jgi:tellurite resistance protein TerC|nr:Integral rane protein TerC [Gemmatimonadota bacterium]
MIATNIWFWVGFIAFVLAMLSLDLGVFNRTPHVVKPKEALAWTGVWVGLALLFALGLAFFVDRQTALTFLTGYVVEESLSIDNIFVIVLIFQYFAVPAQYQHRVLFWGILGALVMRGLFIAIGAALLARFEWIIFVFGALLVITGIRMALKQDEEFDGEQNPVVKFVRRFLPVTDSYRGKHFFTMENGRRHATPLFLVLVLVEATDLIFAVDSIPAIFGITRDPFIVFTSNIFAIMGLRSLFFLLASVVTKFHLLKYGLAIILTFVGTKMILEHWIHIPILLSLAVVLGVLVLSIVASLIWPQAKQASEGKTGSMFGRSAKSE